MTRNTVLILGVAGRFGRVFAQLLHNEGMRVSGIDPEQPDQETAGLLSGSVCSSAFNPNQDALEMVREADWVISCMPQEPTLAAFRTLEAHLSAGALFTDILSVKMPVVSLLQSGRKDIECLSIHPMFAPSVSFLKQNVAIIKINYGRRSIRLETLLLQWGAKLHYLTAEQHDRCTAAIQVATHAAILSFGLALKALHYNISETLPVSSPIHRTLLALLARIINGDPEVYWQIQADHPWASPTREEMIAAAKELQRAVESGTLESFSSLLQGIRPLLGEANDSLCRLAADLLQAPA